MTKLLIVEDEAMLREVYVTLFTLEQLEVYQASNGKEALQQIKENKPDIVLLDVLMPIMGGIEFLQKLKLQQNHPDIKVLVLSNLSDEKTLSTITKLGATKYMLKASVSPGQLVDAVRELAS
jgi:DNA-binding NarL/FixJ family response regulator